MLADFTCTAGTPSAKCKLPCKFDVGDTRAISAASTVRAARLARPPSFSDNRGLSARSVRSQRCTLAIRASSAKLQSEDDLLAPAPEILPGASLPSPPSGAPLCAEASSENDPRTP